MTLSGVPKRPRYTAGPNRDKYVYRADYEKKTGKALDYNTILDHTDPNQKSNPKAEVKPISRSSNSKKDANIRKDASGKFVHKPAKGKANGKK
jgi:hypothetical protein